MSFYDWVIRHNKKVLQSGPFLAFLVQFCQSFISLMLDKTLNHNMNTLRKPTKM